MAEKLTPQQEQAIHNRGGRLLVSAAAGSGKTKVLVDRLLLYVTESQGKVNIDDFLMITYTKAAAAELRGKIAAKLNERMAEDPGNKHLQRQIQRLYLTKISTVHSFCGDILREYAYRLDIPGDFRVADETECQLLQLQVMDKLLEKAYLAGDPAFYAFLDSQEFGRDDRNIPQLVLKVYHSARCHAEPDSWLIKCLESNNCRELKDVSQTQWGKLLILKLHHYLDLQLEAFTNCAVKAEQNGTMDKAAVLFRDTINQLTALRNLSSWDKIVSFGGVDYGRLTFAKNCTDLTLAEQMKAIRNTCKKGLEKQLAAFSDPSSTVLSDLASCFDAAKGLISLVQGFSRDYEAAKKSRRIMDFGDLEHKMLDLLMGKNRTGITSVAEEIGERFVEIMVDEYQDSNEVQDLIFSSLTDKRKNLFMVGDVKQSIYQFRLADPSIFLKKYHEYAPADSALPGEGRKILLSSNFRSAAPVIQAVNDVFTQCMYEDVGGLQYGEDELLREGIPHSVIDEPEIQLCVVDVQSDTYAEEASLTADKIAQLLDGTHYVRDKNGNRPIVSDDIVILLRSPGSVGEEFRYALEKRGIRVNFGNGGDLLETEEAQFLRAMLRVIDNPLQDIPMLSAVTSRYVGFTADDLAVMRAGSRHKLIFDSLKKSDLPKAKRFLDVLHSLRKDATLESLSDLVYKIISVTRMDSILSSFQNYETRRFNLQTFCRLVSDFESTGKKELSRFLDFLDSSEEKGITVAGEHTVSGAVTIMSIHKSKGLEFPVVFLCGLSRDFNREDARDRILCHKDLGIGLSCVDAEKRIRYPSIAKKAIAEKILEDGLSEEMRVLYVAMTRAKDRLIMTYAVKNPEKDIADLVYRMDMCHKNLLISQADCPGTWILLTALRKIESGALFALADRPADLVCSQNPWKVTVEKACCEAGEISEQEVIKSDCPDWEILRDTLSFTYPYSEASQFPSKLTVTGLKGREKDQEVSENAGKEEKSFRRWKKPSFAEDQALSGVEFGNRIHKIMQCLDLKKCHDAAAVGEEIRRLTTNGFIKTSDSIAEDAEMVWHFLNSSLGTKLRNAETVVREFKFSVLRDAGEFIPQLRGEQILLQGVVDCAIIEPDGITVIDFKTDVVTDGNLDSLVSHYSGQVKVYANVLSEIYQKPILSASLYFFRKNLNIPIE